MDILRDQSLRDMNTFGLPAVAQWFARVSSMADLQDGLEFARKNRLAVMPLGKGSNVVLAGDPPGLVLHIAIPGFDVEAAGSRGVLVRVAAGEDWSELVDKCLDCGLYGLENLALVPGTAGAAPIQNIGAYGIEVGNLVDSVEAVDVETGRVRVFDNGECAFGYRNSVFKKALKDRFVIASITLRLSREPSVKASYGALATELANRGVLEPTPDDVAEAVRHLRRTKLPDPAVTGNAGSFFENPVVDVETAGIIRSDHPDVPTFPADDGRVKLAAAWLIDRCGFKGVRRGAAGVHPAHALVIVNHGGATGSEILALADEIRSAVMERFGVSLVIEPRIVG